jgi:hypothetical protein
LAQKLALEERLIREQIERVRRGRGINRANLEIGPTEASTSLSREDQLLSLLLRFPGVRSAVESELSKDIAQFPEIVGDIHGSVAEPLVHIENQQIWQIWLRHAEEPTTDLTAWLDALDPYLTAHAQRLLTYQDTPELPVINRQYHAAELATRIAKELRKTVVIHRKNQLKAMYESVDDPEDQRTLEARLVALNRYHSLVIAPRRSTFYPDLGTRLDQLK